MDFLDVICTLERMFSIESMPSIEGMGKIKGITQKVTLRGELIKLPFDIEKKLMER